MKNKREIDTFYSSFIKGYSQSKSQKKVNSAFSTLLKRYGYSVKALKDDWMTKRIKFMNFLKIGISPTCSILDVGCGLGFLCKFLRERGWQGKYTGMDINPDMIAMAKKHLPNEEFICLDLVKDKKNLKKYDYVVCCAVLEVVSSKKYLKKMVEEMFSLTKNALVFNVFSDRVDFRDNFHLYVSPAWLLRFCYSLTNRLLLRNDSTRFDIWMVLFKKTSIGKYNVFRDISNSYGWNTKGKIIV